MCPPDDTDLVTRLQRGEAAAFATLLERYDGALRRAALAFVSTPASADEVVQDTWLAVVHGLHAFERRSSIKTWIFGILINRAKTRGVREARSVPVSAMSEADEAACERLPARVAETPKQRLLRKELAGALEAAILGLPARQRTIVVLRDALGWSPEDVRHLLDVNEPNQRVLLHRARSKVRGELERYLTGVPA
jgi:RNA polymerase sigma-70 factor (ECF subfamily)